PPCFTWNSARTSADGRVPTWQRGSGVGRSDGFTGERGQDGVSLTGRDAAPYSGYRQGGLGSGGWVGHDLRRLTPAFGRTTRCVGTRLRGYPAPRTARGEGPEVMEGSLSHARW